MKPLLWKEFRELRAVLLLAAVGFPVCLGLLHMTSVVDRIGVNRPSFFTWVGMIAAIALGAGQVVSERSAKTLDYLLGRPVAGRQVVLAKFIAGSTVLFTLAGLLLALFFLGGKSTATGSQRPSNLGTPVCWCTSFRCTGSYTLALCCFLPLWNSAPKRSRVDCSACSLS